MDPFIVIFVSGLCLVAFYLTLNVRRDFIAKEQQRRERDREAQHTRRKP